MPRKKNGWGPTNSNQFKGVNNRVDKAKGRRAQGYYPSSNSFGSSVTRSAIEQYDLDSNWSRWRKGMEFYYAAAWYRLNEVDPVTKEITDTKITTKLYQGQPEEYDVTFDGYKFATTNADTNSHYVMKRTVPNPPSLGTVSAVRNDSRLYSENFEKQEIHVQITSAASTQLLTSMIGDRISDGVSEASLKNVLTQEGKPAVYKGKSLSSRLLVHIPEAEFDPNVRLNTFVGKIGYLEDIQIRRTIGTEEFKDERFTFEVKVNQRESAQAFRILDPQDLPVTTFDIAQLPTLLQTNLAEPELQSTFVFQKDDYQSAFGVQYVTADAVESEVNELSFNILPFEIKSIINDGNGFVLIEALSYPDELRLYAPAANGFLVFNSKSFTRIELDTYNGLSYHVLKPEEDPWKRLVTDVDPWMDQTFTSGFNLVPATLYTCSCPAYSHAQLRIPQSNEGEFDRKVNRQRRYPLPTAKGRKQSETVGLTKASGRISSWATDTYRSSFKLCKHTVAAMFIEKLKVAEPSQIPSYETRIKFETKLKEEMAQVAEEFIQSYQRGDLSLLELVFATAEGLNMDEVELASAMLNTKF